MRMNSEEEEGAAGELPALICFPSAGSGGVKAEGRCGSRRRQREIVESPGGGVGESGVSVVNLYEFACR